MPSILIKNGCLLDPTLSCEQRDILIQDDYITQVAPNITFQADTFINASNKVILPGLISAHTHTFNTPLRGLTENLSLQPWLAYINYAYAMLGKNPRDLYLWNAIGACGLLKNGTTALLENGRGYQGYLPEIDYESDLNVTAKAFTDVGIRATICPMYADLRPSESLPLHLLSDLRSEDITAMDTFPPPKTDDLTNMLRSLLIHWQQYRDPLVSFCLGPIQPYMCSRQLLEETVELASEFDVAIHTHLLESKPEVLSSTKMFSQPVVEFLATIKFLGPHVSFAHAVWLTDRDIEILAETNTSVVHNPMSNLKLGSGISPIQTMKARGVNVALGIDGTGGSNDSANMFETMKCAALIHKLYGIPSTWIGAPDVFEMCLSGGAKVLRKKIGSLQPGYLADLVILGTERLFMMPKANFINQLVFSDVGDSVETVLVGGRIVVENKEVKTVNESELYEEAEESIQKMYTDITSLNKQIAPALDLLDRLNKSVADHELPFSRLAHM